MAQPIGVILQDLAELDVFFYVLPFLLLFALVFAVLQKINIMGGEAKDNKGVNAVIAVTVALLALQFDSVPIFFQVIFPKLGIGLSILLVAIIMLGLFLDFEKYTGPLYVFLAIAGVVAAWILLSSINDYSWWTGGFWANNISAIVALVIVVVFIVVVVNSGAPKGTGNTGFFVPITESARTSGG
jgi:hypothetical protein